MGQYFRNGNIRTLIVGIITCVTCISPYMILLKLIDINFGRTFLDTNFGRTFIIISLIVFGFIGFAIWNAIYKRVVSKL
jgi:hypothetical protein